MTTETTYTVHIYGEQTATTNAREAQRIYDAAAGYAAGQRLIAAGGETCETDMQGVRCDEQAARAYARALGRPWADDGMEPLYRGGVCDGPQGGGGTPWSHVPAVPADISSASEALEWLVTWATREARQSGEYAPGQSIVVRILDGEESEVRACEVEVWE